MRVISQLTATVADKENPLQPKDHLLKEVNPRAQNSLQLVPALLALLALQARSTGDAASPLS